MESTNDRARDVVKLVVRLLKAESKRKWQYKKADTVWRLAPAGSQTPEDSPQHRFRIAPSEDPDTSEALELCIADYDFKDGFLSHLAHVLFERFALLTTRVVDEIAWNSTPAAEDTNVPRDEPQTTGEADDTEASMDEKQPQDTARPEDPDNLRSKGLDAPSSSKNSEANLAAA